MLREIQKVRQVNAVTTCSSLGCKSVPIKVIRSSGREDGFCVFSTMSMIIRRVAYRELSRSFISKKGKQMMLIPCQRVSQKLKHEFEAIIIIMSCKTACHSSHVYSYNIHLFSLVFPHRLRR